MLDVRNMLQEIFDRLNYTREAFKPLVVTTDSRNCPAGSIFFALKGENFDGNQYLTQALINGACLVVTDNPEKACCITPEKYILVDNTLLALQCLAREWRELLRTPIIGITGTNGKTTTKELTAAVLKQKYNLHYTQGNLNNQIGVPLTLLQLNQQHELAIVEMGASHPGDIKELVDIAEPNYGLITNIGQAHLQGFGSPEGVRRTKGELYDYIRANRGMLFVNPDDATLVEMAQGIEQIAYLDATVKECNPTLTATIGGNDVKTQLIGAYNINNIRAAITIGLHFGISMEQCISAIENYAPTNNRSMLKNTEHNTLIVDAYNANVSSMNEALKSFSQIKADNKVLILGDMLELGEYSEKAHQDIVDKIAELGFKEVYLIGENFLQTNTEYKRFANTQNMAEHLRQQPFSNKTILLKGSRSIKLETLIPLL